MNSDKIQCDFTDKELTTLHNILIVCYGRGVFKIRDLSAVSCIWEKLQDFDGRMTRDELLICANIIRACEQSLKLGEYEIVGKLWNKILKILGFEDKNDKDIVDTKKIEARLNVQVGSGGFVLTPLLDKDGNSSSELTDSFGKMRVTEKPNPKLVEPEIPQLITAEMENKPQLIRPEDC